MREKPHPASGSPSPKGKGFLSLFYCFIKKRMIVKTLKTFGEAEYIIRADYRSHFVEMRESSVATKAGSGISKG